jgi:TPR repeat protein
MSAMGNGGKVRIWGATAFVLALAAPALAAPQVVTLGVGDPAADPIAACADLAASPFEPGRGGRGLLDDQIFLDGAMAACESALAADPNSAEVQTWLARVQILVGRPADAKPLLENAAAGGNPFAAYLLSRLYGDSLDNTVAEDPERALELLMQAADGGFVLAASDLAERYETGNGVDIDYSEALRLYQQAADAEYGFAVYKLGYFHHGGYAVDVDYDKAAALYQQAADLGEPLGNNGLGQLQEFGQGVPQDYAKAAEYYQLAADKGEKMSQTSLAYFYEQGLGVAQDYDKSFALLTEAAGQGYGFAQAALSIHYLFGQGTAPDAAKAYELAWAAQREGVVYAEGILGYMFAEGLGTNRDLSSALFHYQAGADGGDQYSADRIPVVEAELACLDAAGSQYEPGAIGRGLDFEAIDADLAIAACENALQLNPGSIGDKVWLARAYAGAERYQDAVPLLEEGVAAGNVLADVVYGDLLMEGLGVDADPARAIAHYETAAAKSFGLAQYALGIAYAEGLGVEPDATRAHD